jgi:tRNA dimethylallyltransferase
MKKKVIIIGGPTGVGKSELAFKLAERIEGELISCDSVQVYKDLEIGANKTAKDIPGREHLLDLVEWTDEFTAADFHDHCTQKIEEIIGRDKVPILVGGTGFYLDWILRGRPSAPPTDPVTLKSVEEELEGKNWDEAFKLLQEVDPEYSKVILKNDFYRLKRSLAVHRATGLPLSNYKRTPSKLLESYDFRCFFITADREYICRNIDGRCEEMLVKGLLEEVRELSRRGLSLDCKAGRSIGYFESLNLLEKFKEIPDEKDFKQQKMIFLSFLDEFKSATRQYSRKQENWFASKTEFRWIRRPTPFNPINPETSPLFSILLKAIQIPRQEYDSIDGWLVDEDAAARDLVTDQVRKKMKCYKGPQTRFTGKFLEDFLKRIQKLIK